MAMSMSVFDQDSGKFLLNEYQFNPIPYDELNKTLFKLYCQKPLIVISIFLEVH